MPLPSDWVDELFKRLTIAYGDRFLAQWPGQLPAAVKAHWGAELDGITSGGIAYALAHLPADYPVNAMQFGRLCRGRPSSAAAPTRALAGPPVDPQRVARVMAAAERVKPKDPLAWAHQLRQREHRGERLDPQQRVMWRAALPRMHEPSNDAARSPVVQAGPVNLPADEPYPETPT